MSGRGAGEVERDERARALAPLFDAEYYANQLGQPYEWGQPGWVGFFGDVADAIVAELAPKSVLDAGCGIGFLVGALRRREVDAYGFDVSDYAISQVPNEFQPYCWVGSITEELDRDYDLIVCIEVLEHLPPEIAEDAIRNLAGHTSQILFSSTPFDFKEPTHYGVRTLESWIGLFARHGFFRNVDFDASFIAPHAVLLTRSTGTAVAVARDYERWHWRHRAELNELREGARRAAEAEARAAQDEARNAELARELRDEAARLRTEAAKWRDEAEVATAQLAEWNAFKGRSGYRIFLRLANLRTKFAPRGTARDRAIRGTLRTFANAVDRAAAAQSAGSVETRAGLAAVLFVSACPGDAMRYRRDHQAAELALAGATVDVAEETEVDFQAALERYECFILHRVPWSTEVERFIREAQARGKRVLFDTDDLVFDPEARGHVAALLEKEESERALYVHGLKRFQRTLQECDGVIVSTEPLREAASRYNPNVEIAYNVASDEMTRLADVAVAGRRHRDAHEADAVTIAYFSGTATHNVDFAEAADAVLWALETYPQVRFQAVGHLTLDARFDSYEERVQRVPLQPWQQLPELVARTDINLAPLEPRNPFTDCKSCIKYIEAGLVGTPTIASPRSDFVRAIEHGRNGLLADSPDEWRTAIRTLVESPELRKAIGSAAFDDVRANHTVRARSQRLVESVTALVRPDDDARLTVNWLVRAPQATREKDRMIFRLADQLAGRGHQVRVYVEPVEHLAGKNKAQVASFIDESFDSPQIEIGLGHSEIAEADATIATNWQNATTVASHDASLFKLYFVADYEPGFYEPEDLEAVAAEQTFMLPLKHITVGQQLAGALRAQTGKEAGVVDFAVDDAFRAHASRPARVGAARVLFHARPDRDRRGYDLGLRALERVKRGQPDVDVILFGATDEELGPLPVAARNLGPLDAAALAAAFGDADVFLDLSFASPSQLPLEAMASGCAVVALDVPAVAALVAPGVNCLVAAPDAGEVAATVLRLLGDDELRARLTERGCADTAQATYERSAAELERILRETCFARLQRPAS